MALRARRRFALHSPLDSQDPRRGCCEAKRLARTETMKLRGLGSVFQPSYTVDGRLHRAKTWSISCSVNGRRVRESAKTTNRVDAVRLLKKRLSEAAAGKPV